MTYPAPGHVGNMQKAVNAAKVDKKTVVRDILDDAFKHRIFG